MAGGYTGYYYTYTTWDLFRPLDVPRGYGCMKNFGSFWLGTTYWQLQPSNQLASSARCLSNPGKEYIVYQNKAVAFTVEITGAAAPLVLGGFGYELPHAASPIRLQNWLLRYADLDTWMKHQGDTQTVFGKPLLHSETVNLITPGAKRK